MLQRMIGAAMFNAATYEEIEADQGALGQAVMVVLLVAVCGAVGGIIGGVIFGLSLWIIILLLVGGLVSGIVGWALWTTVLYIVGAKMLRAGTTETSWTELGRVVGFAYTPGVLGLLGFIPLIGGLFSLVGWVWTVACVVVGVRQALDFDSTVRAIVVVVIAGIISVIPYLIVAWFVGFGS